MEVDKKKYEEYVKEITPVHSLPKSMACAFLVGGVICTIGQLITNFLTNRMGLEQEPAAAWNLLALILLSIILTGLNIYPVSYTHLDVYKRQASGRVPETGEWNDWENTICGYLFCSTFDFGLYRT